MICNKKYFETQQEAGTRKNEINKENGNNLMRYYKCKLVNEFLEKHKEKISIIFLPPYSPNLNLIERLWKYLRKKTIHTHYYEKFADFRKAIFGQINDFENQKKELKSFIGTDFHLFNIGNLNL